MAHPVFISLLAIMGSLAVQNIGSAFAKSLFPLVGPEGVTSYRVGLSVLMLALVFRPWRGPRLSLVDIRDLFLYGASLGLMNLSIYQAFALIPIGVAVAIEITGPLLVACLTSRRLSDFFWIALAVSGLLLLLPPEGAMAGLDPLGVLFAVGAAICWALYIIFGRRASRLGGGRAAALGMIAAAIIAMPPGLATQGMALLDPVNLALGLAAAILCTAIPYSLEMIALPRLPVRLFGMSLAVAPAMGAVAAWIMLGEALTPLQIAAILIVIFASFGAAAFSRKC